MEFIVCLENPK